MTTGLVDTLLDANPPPAADVGPAGREPVRHTPLQLNQMLDRI